MKYFIYTQELNKANNRTKQSKQQIDNLAAGLLFLHLEHHLVVSFFHNALQVLTRLGMATASQLNSKKKSTVSVAETEKTNFVSFTGFSNIIGGEPFK